MDERWQEIERLYHAARELDGSKRAEFLAKACAGDDSLRHEVELLLAQDEEAGSFLERPALEMAGASLLADESLLNPPARCLPPGQ
jgi:eukaryotic-like serine/threonine-protein kinase